MEYFIISTNMQWRADLQSALYESLWKKKKTQILLEVRTLSHPDLIKYGEFVLVQFFSNNVLENIYHFLSI